MSDVQFSAVAMDLKERALHARVVSLGSLLVASSGGTDSAFLAWFAHQVLGDNMLALLADSPSLPRRELKTAIKFAERYGIPLSVKATQEMSRPEYTRNDSSRCFHCKSELFTVMERERDLRNFKHIAYGKNLDDQTDFRPGDGAAKEHRVVAPLADVGLTKHEIRLLAQRYGLEVWDMPASACLSSRLPGLSDLTSHFDSLRSSDNFFFALRVDVTFDYIHARAMRRTKEGVPLLQAAAVQPEFLFANHEPPDRSQLSSGADQQLRRKIVSVTGWAC